MAERLEDHLSEGEWSVSGKEVVFDGEHTRFESGDVSPSSPCSSESPVGRLRLHKDFWLQAMAATKLVCSITLSIISNGYQLRWNSLGPATIVRQPNHPSALDEKKFVSETVAKGLELGTWKQARSSELKCIMPLGVACHRRTGKKRLIFDCRHLNRHLKTTKFKMESLHVEGRSLFQKGWFGGTIDLTGAYYHIEMHPSAYEYLGFEWEGRYYYYTVLPFGISTAPYIFTLVMKTTVAYLRSCGAHFIQYLDDLPFAAPSATMATDQGAFMIATLRSFGWLVHMEKCIGISAAIQCFEALGSVIDLVAGLFRTPAARIDYALTLAHLLLSSERPPVRLVAQVKGLLGSMWLGTGEHARIRTRALGKAVDSRLQPGEDPAAKKTWRRRIELSPAARAELQWWSSNISRVDGRPIQKGWLEGTFDGTIATDASDSGFGGWVSIEGRNSDPDVSVLAENILEQAGRGFSAGAAKDAASGGLEVWGPLPCHLQGNRASSTLREVYGAYKLISLLSKVLTGGRFRLHFDNMSCVMGLGGKVPPSATGGKEPKSVLGGSRVDEIQAYIIKILDLAVERNIELVAIWVPRAENERSDLLSRTSELARAEYWMSDAAFAGIDSRWGCHSLDVFSMPDNVRVTSGRFMSKFYDSKSVWIDSLSVRWPHNEVIWAHPPPRLVGAAIRQFQASGASGTLIVPWWPTAPWWPMIYPRGNRWGPAQFVKEVMRVGRARDVMEGLEERPSSNFGSSMIFALRISCRQSMDRAGGLAGSGARRTEAASSPPPAPATR